MITLYGLLVGDKNPSPVKDKLLEMVKGIRETDTLHLMTAHNIPSMTFAITPWEAESCCL